MKDPGIIAQSMPAPRRIPASLADLEALIVEDRA
jgi:hypothetical protein